VPASIPTLESSRMIVPLSEPPATEPPSVFIDDSLRPPIH
jgi:hypothetical protein